MKRKQLNIYEARFPLRPSYDEESVTVSHSRESVTRGMRGGGMLGREDEGESYIDEFGSAGVHTEARAGFHWRQTAHCTDKKLILPSEA